MSAPSLPCPERKPLLHGLADGELDAANALALEEHLQACAGCAAAFSEIMRGKELLKRDRLRFRVPESLKASILATLAEEDSAASAPGSPSPAMRREIRPKSRFLGYGAAAFSAMALAASLILFVSSWNPEPSLDSQLVAAHVRSLLVTHLTDVASSDQHTVKPWFLGKLDFAPAITDLTKDGFPLIGGRLDYLGGRIVPAIVYKHGGHVINLFVWPEGQMRAASETLDGYHILSWTRKGFSYTAVSDLNLSELRSFENALENAPS